MCGLAGFVDYKQNTTSAEVVIESMLDTIRHRGPDGSGIWIDKCAGVFLGHRRLSIHDLSDEGHQPMVSRTGRYVLSYNGEIYNFLAIKRWLLEKGYTFKSHSDTEVLLSVIEYMGVTDALDHLNGMFAFALWDRENEQLTLVRDRMGEKPLYYGWQGAVFLFGSELKALRAHPGWIGGVDRKAVARLLSYGYIPAPATIHPEILKVEPGEMVTLSRVGESWSLNKKYWWSLQDNIQYGNDNRLKGSSEDAVYQLESILKEVLTEHQLADVPVGAFLSGGIDSSTVVALMQSISSAPIETFTMGSPNRDYDESDAADAIAKQLGTKHTEWVVEPNDGLSLIFELPVVYDEPFADASQIPTLLVSRLARKKVTVALSGDGGDEIFGGYNRHIIAPKISAWLNDKPQFLKRIARKMIHSISPKLWDHLYIGKERQFGEKIYKVAKVLDAESEWEIYSRLVQLWESSSMPVLGESDLCSSLSQVNSKIKNAWVKGGSFSECMMLIDSAIYLPDDILVKVDRAAMSCGLETRAPLLDYRVVSFAQTLPLNMKIHNGEGKWILRQLLDTYLPRSLMSASKSGFGIPLHEWLRNELREWAEELLDYNRLRSEGVFDPLLIRNKWNEHLSGRFNHQYELWGILMFQAWYEQQ